MLYNIRRIRPLLTQKEAEVLVQVLVLVQALVQVLVQALVQVLVISHLDYCSSLLAGLPAAAIRPLQLIQKASAPLVFHLSSLTLLCSSSPFTGYQ